MKILHLVDRFDYCDGRSRHVYFLARGQRRLGHDVKVITGTGDALVLLQHEDIPVECMRFLPHEERTIPNFLRGAFQLRKMILAYRPDLIHCHHFYAANLVSFAVIPSSIKKVLTVHSNISPAGILPKYIGDKIIAVSNSTYETIISQNRSVSSKIVVIPNGSEFLMAPASMQQTAGLLQLAEMKHRNIVITYAGRIAESKGIHVLLRALNVLNSEIPLVCVIAGSGSYENVIKQQNLTGSVETIWLGNVQDLRPVFELSDIIVIPSLPPEGLPMTLLEGGLSGRAVIASRTDGISEVIEDGATGVLVTPGNVGELINGLRRLSNDRELRSSLGRALFKKVSEKYSLDTMVRSVISVYRSVLPEGSETSTIQNKSDIG